GRDVEGLLQGVEPTLEGPADRKLLAPGELGPCGAGPVVDEPAVALVGGNPPGRGVRALYVAEVLEEGHVVAHGGCRDGQAVALTEGLRADRLADAHVLAD